MADAETERRGPSAVAIVIAVLLVTAVAVAWLGPRLGWFEFTKPPKVLVLYCFSALDDVMEDGLLPAFRERWRSEEGEAVEFVATFAGSGEITDRILARVPAEVAVVSSELDAHRLPAPWRAWRELPHQGILARTPLVIVTRAGNPHRIGGFEDLGREGLRLLHSDPATSGAGELAVVAEYAAARRRHPEPDLALGQLLGLWRNVTTRVPTAREMRTRFERGEGDAFITYEADVVGSPSRARIEGEIVYPPHTVIAEPVVVKIEKSIDDRQRRLVAAFVEFLWSREAQEILAVYGFRSVAPELDAVRADLGIPESPLTLDELGGAAEQRATLDRVWRDRVLGELGR